jgi:glycosyltransferase involved in cell wall biosynthesis
MHQEKSFLIIGNVWPEPQSSAAGTRMMQLIEVLVNDGFTITFASTAERGEFSADLEDLGVRQKEIKLNDPSFDEFVAGLKPDYVLFDRFMIEEQFGWRVAEFCPDAVRILDTVDLHSLRAARQKAWKNGQSFKLHSLLTEDVARREIASILRSDLSLIISEAELEILQELFMLDEKLLHYLPFLLKPEDVKDRNDVPTFDKRRHFVTIGNFRHEPNWNAVQWLKEEIWPLIRNKLPDAEMHIYGSYASQKVTQMHKPNEGFLVKGRAPDAIEVIREARVLLAPLRFGAGLKGKLVDAMLSGTPSVTTDIGAEGMIGVNSVWCGGIENGAESFAEAAVSLYTNKWNWQDASEMGFVLAKDRFGIENFSPQWISRITNLKKNLQNHRSQNFLGSILLQNTLASTKYMAKWIQEKNRNKNL